MGRIQRSDGEKGDNGKAHGDGSCQHIGHDPSPGRSRRDGIDVRPARAAPSSAEVRRLGSGLTIPRVRLQQPRRLERGRDAEFGPRHLEPLLHRMGRDAEIDRHFLGGLVMEPPHKAGALILGQPAKGCTGPLVDHRGHA